MSREVAEGGNGVESVTALRFHLPRGVETLFRAADWASRPILVPGTRNVTTGSIYREGPSGAQGGKGGT